MWAKNCRSWGELDVRLPEGITAVVGENGAGKSTLVNCVDLALFASPRELPRLLSRSGEGPLELGCEFEHHGEVYRVRRSYSPAGGGKSRLDFERHVYSGANGPSDAPGGWHTETRETQAATQQALEELLGVSRTTFRASAFLAQDDGAAFTAAQPRERKAILAEALGLEVYGRLLELARADQREAEVAASKALALAEQAEGQLQQHAALDAQATAAATAVDQQRLAVADLEAGLTVARGEHGQALAAAEARRSAEQYAEAARRRHLEAQERAQAIKARNVQREQRLGEHEALAAKAAQVPELEAAAEALAEANRLSAAAEAAGQQHEHALAEQRLHTRHLDELEARTLALGQGEPCPTCGQPLQGEALAKAVSEVGEQLAAERTEHKRCTDDAEHYWLRQCEAAEQAMAYSDKVPEHLRAHGALDAQLRTARSAAQQVAAMDALRAEHEREQAELAEVEAGLPALAKARSEAEAKAAEYEGADVASLERRVRNAEAKLASERGQLEVLVRAAENAQARLEALVEVAEQASVQRKAWAEAGKRAAVCEALARAFGPDGIPALIIENAAIPMIEAEANRVVAELGRSYRFELRTERALKTRKGTTEALDIIVYADGTEAAYEDFSGGEQTRLNLALRIGLARLLAGRRGAEVGLLAIDEPSYLDEAGFERLAQVLRGLQAEFPCILVVSHIPALRDAFDAVLAVSGGGDTGNPSSLEVAA